MDFSSSLVATLFFVSVINCFCTSEIIFIKTSSSDHQWRGEPCLTLQEFTSHHHRVESNTVLKFLAGIHMLQFGASKNISIVDVVNVTLTGVSDLKSSVIHCMSEFSVIAMNVQNLTISNLHFTGCGAAIFPRIASVTLLFEAASSVSILNTRVHNSKGAGMLAVNAFGLILNQTSFVGNEPNCVITFQDEGSLSKLSHVSTDIADSEFANGRSKGFLQAVGLSLIFFQTYTVHVNIVNATLCNNIGRYLSNFFMFVIDQSCKHTIVQAVRVRSSNDLKHLKHFAPGFSVQEMFISDVVNPHNHQHFEYTIHVLDSHFEVGMGTIVVEVVGDQVSTNLRARLTNVSIEGNKTFATFGLDISKPLSVVLEKVRVTACKGEPIRVTNSNITMQDILVEGNEGTRGAVALWKSQVTFLGSTVFIQNHGHRRGTPGTLYAQASTLIFQGSVEFVNNIGYNGGALSFCEGSKIVIGRQAQLKFIGNYAYHLGGAIYVDSANYHMLSDYKAVACFYEVAETISASIEPHVSIENSTAEYAGSALYGGWVDFCGDPIRELGYSDFDSLFQINGGGSDLSVVSSDPLRVCLCVDSKPDCSITLPNISAYPGTTIYLPMVAVGQKFGVVPSTVRSDILFRLTEGNHPRIKDWQHTQKVARRCTNLIYTLMSPSQVEVTIKVETESLDTPDIETIQTAITINNSQKKSIDPDLYIANLLINIKMLPCPLGFEFQNKSMTCICNSKLIKHGINCSIDTQTIWRKNSFWITTVEASRELIVHEHCPFDYCKPDSFNLNLEDPDEQCAFNRSGILCGACQHNLSHVFGTSACMECSSMWALLWVPLMALAGIALVVLLIVLNLTVSVGTINGLIFYANIVRANHAIFFPPNTTNSFLSWFIAWINLDLGIETCFYNGLDAYVKTWLQFVFPLYIWFLVITIIVLSHYFTFAARLSGRNAVPVLATLFLLSYAKLLQFVITVFSSTRLSDGHQQRVWLYDGNVNYLKGEHTVLFTAALLVLLVLSVPYTTLLVLTQYTSS